MENMTNTKAEETKREEPCRLNIISPQEFKGDIKTNITTTIKLADMISKTFMDVCHDYCGCKIRINDSRSRLGNDIPVGALYVEMYFKDFGDPKEDGVIKNIVPRFNNAASKYNASDNKNNIVARYINITGASDGRIYDVTRKTFELLEEFMFDYNPRLPLNARQRIRWDKFVWEEITPMDLYGNKQETVVCISGIDLNKIVSKFYGATINNEKYDYMVTPSTIIPSQAGEFVVQISQLDVGVVRELQNTLGLYNSNNTIYHSCR